MNLVISDSDDMEHVSFVKTECKLFAIYFHFT